MILIILVLLFSGYMIWDNRQIYAAAENVALILEEVKPIEDEEGKLDFSELLAINPDVKFWLSIGGTDIDAPVVQGRDNYYYLNRDIFGKLSMAGAIYLDSRNSPDFSDIYNIVYGHHMKGSLMFGDLDNYMDETFFNENQTGSCMFPDGSKDFDVLAVMKVSDSAKEIFRPSFYYDDLSALCKFIEEHAMHVSEESLARLKAAPGDWQVISFVTCTDGSTGTRLVLLVMTPYDKPVRPDKPDKPDDPTNPVDPTDPTNPVDPKNPTDPTHPTDPTDPADPYNPPTGDTVSFLLLFAIASCAVCVLMHSKKRRGEGFKE